MSKIAGDIMTKNIITVKDDTSINNLIGIFIENKISCAPVVNKKEQLVGIVTKTDVLSYLLDIDLDVSLKVHLKDVVESITEHGDFEISSETDLKAGNIMTPNPITADENTSIESLAKIMIDHNIHRLIIEKDSAIVGIISTLDILYHVAGIDKNG
ncbi:CBS domain-containing protein [Candidatus Latescibacterota bacterium]